MSLVRLTLRRAGSPARSGQQRQQRSGQHEPVQPAARRSAPPRRRGRPPAAAHLRVGDEVHVDVAGAADGPGADARPGEHARPAGPRGWRRARAGWRSRARAKSSSALGDVVADDLVVGAAERLDQRPLRGQRRPGRRRSGRRCAATCTASRSPPADRAAIRAARRISVSPSGPPVSATTTRSRVSQVPCDAVLGAVALQRLVDLVGQPQQGELAQRGEVADAEVVGQRRVDLLRRVDVAVRHPAAQRLGRHVDELDLVGARGRPRRAPSRAAARR